MEKDSKRKDKDNAKSGNRALVEVDERIAVALVERDEASRKVSLLVYWQDRLTRINQDIDTLISIQQRLTGKVPEPIQGPPIGVTSSIGIIPYSHTAVIPNNVSSVPRQAQPAPSGANVASEVEGEGGFG